MSIGKSERLSIEFIADSADSLDYIEKTSITDKTKINKIIFQYEEIEIYFPPNIKYINNYTFKNSFYYLKLKNLIFDCDVIINYEAFMNCKTSLIFDCDVAIKYDTFINYNITEITFTSKINIGKQAFMNCESLKTVIFGASTVVIGEKAFKNCKSLVNLIFSMTPDEFTSIKIDKYVFDGCSSLINIILPSNIMYIGNGAFSNCLCLQTVDLSSTRITELAPNIFINCRSLITIYIPSNITHIGNHIFAHCTKLREIIFLTPSLKINSSIKNQENIIFPSSIEYIGIGAFHYCVCLKTVDFSVSTKITRIPHDGFSYCENLTSIILPPNIKIIGKEAFSNCKKMGSITFPSTLIYINDLAFYNCKNMPIIKFTSDDLKFGYYAFNDCNIKEVHIQKPLDSIILYNYSNETLFVTKITVVNLSGDTIDIEVKFKSNIYNNGITFTNIKEKLVESPFPGADTTKSFRLVYINKNGDIVNYKEPIQGPIIDLDFNNIVVVYNALFKIRKTYI